MEIQRRPRGLMGGRWFKTVFQQVKRSFIPKLRALPRRPGQTPRRVPPPPIRPLKPKVPIPKRRVPKPPKRRRKG